MRLNIINRLSWLKCAAAHLINGSYVHGFVVARFYFLFCSSTLIYALIGYYVVYLIRGEIFFILPNPVENPRLLFINIMIILALLSCYYLVMSVRKTYSMLSIFYLKVIAAGCFILIWPSFSNIKILMSLVSDFSFDPLLAWVDAFIHGGADPWHIYSPVLFIFDFAMIDYLYLQTWFYTAFLLPLYVLLFETNLRLRVQFFIVYMLVWIGIGNVLAFAFLSAGPVYYEKVTGDMLRFAEWRSTLHSLGFNDSIAPRIQEGLWNIYSQSGYQLGGGISAFPSVHVGVAMLAALYVWHKLGRLGFVALLYPLLIQIFSVLLGWHYALDGYASILIVALAWRFVGRRIDVARNAIKTQRAHSSASPLP